MVNKDPVSRRTEIQTLFTALIRRKKQNRRKSGKQGYKTPVRSRLQFTQDSRTPLEFFGNMDFKNVFFSKKIKKFTLNHC